MKLTPAQKRFVRAHPPEGVLSRFRAHANYDLVGRVRDLGLIEIVNGESRTGWPYSWEGTRLTEAGREALAAYKQ